MQTPSAIISITGIVSFGLNAGAMEPSFTRLASDPVSQYSRSTGCAWADFNNDGYIDLVTSAFGSNYLLFTNNGNGTFSRADIGDVFTSTGNSFGVCVADYDNDGLLDVFIGRNFGLADYLYHNDGSGVLRRVLTGDIVSGNGNANNCVWGDYDNDGFVDLFVANSDQRDYLFHNMGGGSFAKILSGVVAEKTGNSQGASWGDYDNDGRLDLFVSRVNQPNVLYHNDAGGAFTDVKSGAIVGDIVTGQGTSWGDYNNDGFLDLFVGIPNGNNLLYRNNQDGTFTKVLDSVIATDSRGLGASWADFDNDGFLDLFVPCNSAPPLFYRNRGDGTFIKSTTNRVVTEFSGGFTSCVGDIDNDGFLDLFVSYASVNMLYRNNGTTNGWITLTCEGRLSNRAAIGAKLRLEATIGGRLVKQLREISGGGALGSQNDLRASFGLGDATGVSRLVVEWPSGIKQEFTNLAPRQFMKIIEPGVRLSPYYQMASPGADVTIEAPQDLPNVQWQWRLNEQLLAGETNRIITVANVQRTNLGSYTLAGTSTEFGNFASKAAVVAGDVVLTQPASASARLGSNITFAVSATGYSPISYQWSFNGAEIPFATNSVLQITNASLANEGIYFVVASNGFGATTSSNASLRILINPAFVQQPRSRAILVGQPLRVNVQVSGYPLPLGYRVRKNTFTITNVVMYDRSFMFEIPNAQTNDSGNYSIVVTNAALPSGSPSQNAVIQVLTDRDGDLLPDVWEVEHNLDPDNPSDAALDSDDDGSSNFQEYSTGTNPRDPASVFALSNPVLTPDGQSLTFSFFAASNITYVVETSDSSQLWTRWREHTATSNKLVFFTNSVAPGTVRLFRAVTSP